MVFYFECETPGYTVYMGKDKFENEGLIEWGLRTDLWFHVDGLSSAHVYLRVPLETALECDCKQRCGCLLDKIPPGVVEEMCQLVKANSIAGCKKASVQVVYTPHSNLRKTSDMKDGAVGFFSSAHRRLHLTEKDRAMVKRIEKTRTESHPDLQKEKLQFEKRCTQFLKARRKAAAEAAAAADPRSLELSKKQERENFLASGGYHGAALAAEKQAELAALDAELAAMDAAVDTLVIGDDDEETQGSGFSSGDDDESEEEAEAEEAPLLSWHEEATARSGSDLDARWLQARGHRAEASLDALQHSKAPPNTRLRRCEALVALQPRDMTGLEAEGDASEAAEARAEERESLEAIFGEAELELAALAAKGAVGDGDSEEGGSEDIILPVQGFEPPEDASDGDNEPPPLVLELFIDEVAARGYPMGGAVPLVALSGGGLLEAELQQLTASVVAHAIEYAASGALAFELSSVAAEQATEIIEQREQQAKLREARAARATAASNKSTVAVTSVGSGSAKRAFKAASAAAVAAAAASVGEAVGPRRTRAEARADAQRRLGKFSTGAASSFVTVNDVGGAEDLLGVSKIDKGGYKSKKKKKR
eukprot:COSAG05_NODE_572_length_8615_cov_58.796031_5_plen_594_part_00